jgi:hypothetical protein
MWSRTASTTRHRDGTRQNRRMFGSVGSTSTRNRNWGWRAAPAPRRESPQCELPAWDGFSLRYRLRRHYAPGMQALRGISRRSDGPSASWRTCVAAVVAVCVALSGTACTGSSSKGPSGLPSDDPSSAHAGTGSVTWERLTAAPGGDVKVSMSRSALSAKPTARLQELVKSGLLVGVPLRVDAAKIPNGGVLLRRSYPTPLPAGVTAMLAFYNSGLGAWQAVPSTVSADRMSVSATVDHLSVWTDIVGGTQDAMGDLVAGLQSVGDVVADVAGAITSGVADGAAAAAGWAYNAVASVFDVHADLPSCTSGVPDWVKSTQSIDPGPNDPVRWCVGHDPKKPDLLVVKVVDNRGYAFEAATGVASAWSYNHAFHGQAATTLADLLLDQGAFVAHLVERIGLGPSMVSGGLGVDYGFSEDQVRKVAVGKPLVVLNPPDAVGFLTSILAR